MKLRALTWIKSLLKVAFAILLIWWIFATGKIDLAGLKRLLSPGFLSFGLVFVFLSIIAATERWRRILQSQGLVLSLKECLRLSFIGSFFNFAMPGGVGGDVIKAYYLASDHPKARVSAVTSVAMDRILGLYAMIAMALLVMLLDIHHVTRIQALSNLMSLILILFVGSTLFLFLAFSRSPSIKKGIFQLLTRLPFKQKFIALYESTHLYGKFPGLIFRSVALSFIAQSLSITVMIFAGEASGAHGVPYSVYFLVAPLGFMATAIPVSPAGLGIGQAAFYALFNIYLEKESSLGPTVITALQAFQIFFGLAGAIVYMAGKSSKHKIMAV